MAATLQHIPVMATQVLSWLRPRDGGLYVDCTFGGGGHTKQILAAADTRVIAFDRDADAVAAAPGALGDAAARVEIIHDNYGAFDRVLAELGVEGVDGILLDAGVSSHQLDTDARGFSFMREGPVDMRMNATEGETALDVIATRSTEQLIAILRKFGEEKYAGRIARALKQACTEEALPDTLALAEVIASAIPARDRRQRIHPATRSFQALRIEVNRELEALEQFLTDFPKWLNSGARCAIIAFHSLEDRLVKHTFRELALTSSLPPVYAEQAGERVHAICHTLTKKPVVATEQEIQENPRARSAKLRVCERTEFPL